MRVERFTTKRGIVGESSGAKLFDSSGIRNDTREVVEREIEIS